MRVGVAIALSGPTRSASAVWHAADGGRGFAEAMRPAGCNMVVDGQQQNTCFEGSAAGCVGHGDARLGHSGSREGRTAADGSDASGATLGAPRSDQLLEVFGAKAGASLLRHPLARGGMGDVWAAQRIDDGSEMAIKFERRASGRACARQRSTHEARVLDIVRHPHVVELLGTGSAGGCSFVAMELLDGRTLSAEITLGGPLSLDAAALTLRHAACALEHVHAAGIVHRDIKPQNLFVCGSGPTARVKLIDFGLATERAAAAASPARSHRPSQIAGSLAFMSPDDRLGLSLPDVQSDLWALAVTAYVLLTKRLPFRARSGEIGRHCPLASRFELPSHHRADIPQTIDDWFERAFSRDRSARFRSALDASGAFCRAIAAERLIASSARHCLSDDEILAFCAGAMSPAAVRLADAHCGACEACSEVLSAIAGCSETPDEPVTPTRLESTRPHGGRGLSGEATERRAPTLRCVPRGRARAPTPLLLLDR